MLVPKIPRELEITEACVMTQFFIVVLLNPEMDIPWPADEVAYSIVKPWQSRITSIAVTVKQVLVAVTSLVMLYTVFAVFSSLQPRLAAKGKKSTLLVA